MLNYSMLSLTFLTLSYAYQYVFDFYYATIKSESGDKYAYLICRR